MRIQLAAAARRDLLGIARYIAVNNPERASSFTAELLEVCRHLGEQPERFSLVPGYESKGYRRRPYGNYLIIYVPTASSVKVFRVLHAAMDLRIALGD